MKMTIEGFEEYEKQFNNASDKSKFFDRYYDPNADFIHPYIGTFRGKSELVRFWNTGKNSGHDGIHELLHLKVPNHGRLFRSLLRSHLSRPYGPRASR